LPLFSFWKNRLRVQRLVVAFSSRELGGQGLNKVNNERVTESCNSSLSISIIFPFSTLFENLLHHLLLKSGCSKSSPFCHLKKANFGWDSVRIRWEQ
jgi:hypothetical protein